MEADIHRPEMEADVYRPEMEADVHRPEMEADVHRPEMEAGRDLRVCSKSPKRMWPMKASSKATRSTVYPTSRIQGIACTCHKTFTIAA